VEKDVEAAARRFDAAQQQRLFRGLAELILDEARPYEMKGDSATAVAAKRAALRVYEARARLRPEGGEPVPSRLKYELAELYLAVGEDDKALALFEELREGAYSLVALSGLGTVAERQGNREQALAYWRQMLRETRVGNPLWFRGTYDIARTYYAMDEAERSCRMIRPAARLLSRLPDEALKRKIEELARTACDE
jgi:tetratricopeptide (TPR) repeat protein